MKYEPKTTEWMRRYNWGAEAQQLVTDDLTSCESCLAEAEREVERLRAVLRELVVSGGNAIKGDYSDWDYAVAQVEALLNSEGRAVT